MMKPLAALLSVLFAGAAPGGDDPAPKPRPKPNAPYVEFDFSALTEKCPGRFAYTITILSADKDLKFSMETSGDPKDHMGRRPGPRPECSAWSTLLRINDWKAEVVDKTKLRVYGVISNGKLIPATEGKVESPTLKKDELPKVKNPPKA